jgi:microcystin-dependent protein
MNRNTLLAVLGVCVAVVASAQVRVFVPDTPAMADDVNHNFVVVAPPGSITIWAGVGATPPEGWLFCDGATFSATTWPGLAAALGSTTLPDLRGRVVVGLDAAGVRVSGGAANTVGKTGGVDVNTDVPAHAHPIPADPGHVHYLKAACNNSTCGNGADGFTRGNGSLDSSTFTVLSGGGHNHGGATSSAGVAGVSNLQPFVTLRYIIKG